MNIIKLIGGQIITLNNVLFAWFKFENVYLKVQRPAVLTELKKLRKNKVTDRALIDRLTEIWYRHSLHEISMSKEGEDGIPPIPKIICGELL